jgi:hypothetical protein
MSLARFRSLLSGLESSRAKNRQGNKVRRSDPTREAEAQKRQAEYRANQDRYRGDFEIIGGGEPGMAYQQVVTGYYNPETGATWSAPHSGYKPKEGTGWVKGYGPNVSNGKPPMQQPGGGRDFSGSARPISSIKEKPSVSNTSSKGKDFEAMLRTRMSKF